MGGVVLLSGHRVQDQQGGGGEQQQRRQQQHRRRSHVPTARFSHAPQRLTQRGGSGAGVGSEEEALDRSKSRPPHVGGRSLPCGTVTPATCSRGE